MYGLSDNIVMVLSTCIHNLQIQVHKTNSWHADTWSDGPDLLEAAWLMSSFVNFSRNNYPKLWGWVIWKINSCKKILRIQTAQLPIKKSRSKQFSTIQRSTRPPAWIKLFSVKFAGQQRPRESWSWFASKDLNLLCLLKTPRETEVQCFSHAKKKRQQKPQPSGWTPI